MIFDAVFDLDGTLVDSVMVCAEIINEMLRDRGSDRRVSLDDTRGYISLGGPSMMAGLMREDCGDPNLEIQEFRDRYAEFDTPRDCLFPGVQEGLLALRSQGVRLSICSAKPQNLCEKVLVDVGLQDYFETIVGRSSERPCKPERAHYDAVLARLGGLHGHSCMIGDGEPDHELAQNADVAFIMVTWGYAAAGFKPEDALYAHDFGAIPDLVADLRSGARNVITSDRQQRRIAS